MNILSLHELKQGISHLFYPLLCEGCNKPLVTTEKILCISCAMELPETGYHSIADNETAQRISGRVPFAYATSYAYFTEDSLLQHLMHGLKYRGKQDIGSYLGKRFAENLRGTDWISTVDIIIPVPLHPSKLAARGYNQSMVVAEAMGRVLGIPASDDFLTRTRETESQTHKSRAERAANMAGAFIVPLPAALAGKHILIVDDVLTTGGTIEACSLALLAEKNVKISIATIGIAIS